MGAATVIEGIEGIEDGVKRLGLMVIATSGVECGTACCPWQENLWKIIHHYKSFLHLSIMMIVELLT